MKVLVVEDDAKLARFLQQVMQDAGGYVADTCSNGADALRQIDLEHYHLVLLDWTLPGLDGVELCRELRRKGHTLPIVMISGRARVEQRVLALEAGADDYLVKPFKMVELVARVRALLRRTSGATTTGIGPLQLDPRLGTVLLDGRALELTSHERLVLIHLMHNADRAVSRSELLMEVWKTGFDPESNLVDVHVSRLRKKLDDHAWMIETLRGQGYRLRTFR
jgi:two-component system OmpR family response regulator